MRTKFYIATILTILLISGAFAWTSETIQAFVANGQTISEQPVSTPPQSLLGSSEYSAYADFSLTQNTNSTWQYGFTADPTSNVFQPLTNASTTATCSGSAGSSFQSWANVNPNDAHMGRNITGATFFCGPLRVPTDAVYMHPGENGQRAVVRWRAPQGGTYQITGVFEGLNVGYREARILKNGVVIGTLNDMVIDGYRQRPFAFTETVAAGDNIDFSLGWGNGTWNSDGTGLAVVIGEPVTACMTAPANMQVNVPAENSPVDVQSVNTNASLVGDATYTEGKVGRAFSFDGNGDYVRIDDNAAQKPANQLTAEGWFKMNSHSGLPHLISKPLQISNFNSYAIWFDAGNIRIGYYQTNGTFTYYDTGFVPALGAWNHYAMVLNTDDSGANANTLKLYVNGVESFSGAAGLPIFYNGINDAYPPHPLLIGADFENNNPQFFLNGQADEVSVYGRALSGSEIFDIVQQGSYGKCAPANCVEPPSGLVSWFAGEQNALDSKSNNHGTLQNGTIFQTARVGQGFKFDGVNDFVEVPDNTNLKPANLTLETWVKFDSLTSTVTGGAPSGYQNIIFKKNSRVAGSGFEGGYSLVKNPDNRLGLGFNSPVGGTDFANSTTVMQTGVWYHVVGTHDGTNIRLFVNGTLEGAGTATFPIDYGTTPLYLGNSQVPFSGFFNGVLDETSIYDRALTTPEVQLLFNAGQSGKCKPSPIDPTANQVAWFTGDGDARDLKESAIVGTLQGDTTYRVGKVAQAFKFDGNGDYISTPDNAKWDFGTGDLAIEGWINTPSGTGVQRIISAGAMSDGPNNLWSLGYGDICAWGCGQRINLAVHNGSGSYSDFSSDQIAIRPNTWHHFAVVRSTTSFTFYFDGVAVGTRSVGAGYALNGGSTGAILGARYNTSPSDRFEFANGMLDEISIYQRAVTGNEIASVYNAGVAGKIKTKTTLAGPNDTTQISDATVTFANVTIGGYISQNGIDLGLMPSLPPNTTFTGLAYNISTTAAYQNGNADDVRVCFNLPALSAIGAGGLRLLHLESGNWIDRTASANSLSNFCSDNLRSLSPFVIVEGTAPSSYGISGRVTTGGNGVANVTVTLSGDASTTATTNANGDYSFGSLNAGGSFTVTPSLAGYSFDPTNRVYNTLSENITNAHFTAAAIPTVSMGDATVTEGDSGSVNADFNVTLSTAYPSNVTVFYSTYDGTATGGLDYTSVGSSVVFAPGETSKVVSVPVLGDTIDEDNEIFNIFISAATNATVLDADGVGTINDNDVPKCVSLPSGRIAAFKGENNVNDTQGTNNGTANGTVTYTVGKVAQAFNFGDASANVSVPDSASLRPDSFTIEGWFNFTNYSNEFRMLLNKQSADPSYSSYNLWIYGGLLNAQSSDGTTLGNSLSHGLYPTPGQWYHIAFTRQAGGQMTLYVNGVAVDSQASNPSVGYAATPLTFGNASDASNQGKIDELSLYNRALSVSDVQSIYNAGAAGICPSGQCVTAPEGQTAWYRGEGNAFDSQGTGNGAGFNGVTYTPGKVGQAFDLPDGNAHVQVPDSAALRPTNFTVEGWFNFSSYNNDFRQLIGKNSADPSYSSYVIYIYGGLLTAHSTNGVDLGNSLNYSLAPIPGQWYHIAFTREEGGTQTLYVNGVAVDSDTANAIAYANTPLILGHGTGGSIHGKIDEVSIFSRAMSAVEIQSIYTAGGAGKCPNGTCLTAPADLQSWYRFQGNTTDVFNLHPAGAQGNPSYVAGRVGQAINLDGVDDSVDLGSWFNYQTFSISMWINVAPFSQQPTFANIIDNNHTGGTNWVMQRVANEDRYAFGDNAGGEVFFTPTPNTWQLVTVTREAGSALKLYVDGALIDQDATIGTIPYNGAQFLRVGRWGGGGRHLKGKVDELDIYTRVLSPTEVASIYNAGTAGKCVPPQCTETPTNQVTTFKAENNANDSQGANNGSVNGGVTYSTGKVGQAFNFPDSNAYVNVPDSSSLRPDSFTIEGWFNFTSYANEYRMLFNKPSVDPSYSSYNLWIYGGLLNAQSSDGTTLGNSLSHGLYPTPGQWYHIAFTRQAGGEMKLYVNGIEVGSIASNASVGYSNSPLTLGSPGASPNGKIDEFSIYSRALSASELQSVFDAGSGGKCPTIGCGTADYQFNDDLTSSIPGAIPLSNIGTGQTFATEVVNGVSERVMTYNGGNAVELRPTSGVIPSNQYEITIVTRLNQNYNYNRILDFKDGTTDSGLYVTSGQLIFLPGGNGGPVIPAGVYVEIKLTRTAAGIVKGYVNGVEQFSFNDTGNNAVIGATNALRFFKDDGGENYGGAIARITLSAGGCGSTNSISGNVSDGTNNLSGVSVALSGGANATTTSDANGNYAFANLPSGLNYTVAPTAANYSFTPPTRTYNSLSANVNDANFVGSSSCTFTLSPDSAQFASAGGTGSFNITTQAGCSWTASPSSNISSWVTLNGPASGLGNGTVNYTVAANSSIFRFGDILINGNAAAHIVGQLTGSGTCPSVNPVTYGTVLNGSLANSDCSLSGRYTDQYSFSGTAGDRVMVRVSSSNFAESVVLHDTANTTIHTFATGGGSTDARIPNIYGFYTLPATGTYVVSVSSWGNGGSLTGNYTFTLHSDRTVPGVTPPAGLIGWYAGEGDTRNQQGNSPGTFNGTASFETDYVGQSFNLNGMNRYIEVPSATEPFNVSSVSVEAWVNTTTLSGDPNTPSPLYRTIASKYNGNGAASWSLDMEAGGAITFYVYDGSSTTFRGVRTVGSAAFLTANEWKHVAATFDQSTQQVRLFVNGSEAGQLIAGSVSSISGIGQNSAPLRIGAYNNGSSVMGFWQGRLDEVSIYNRALTPTEITSIVDAGRIGKIKQATISSQTTVPLGSSTITFPAATSGTATETPIDGLALPAPLPMGRTLELAFDVSTNAPFTGNATVCFALPSVTPAEFTLLKIYHFEGGVWVDRTDPSSVYPNLCAITPSFSPFAIARPFGPTASNVSIGGRVLTDSGQGIKNTHLSLTLADGTVLRTRSSSFGYYRFDSVASGQTGILSIHSKRFTFAQPNRVITISEDLNDLDFIAEP